MDPVNAIIAPAAALPDCDDKLATLHAYWRAIRPAPGRLPGRQHFDPIAVAPLLPWLWLVDVHRAPGAHAAQHLRFKYRLVGSIHVEAGGFDPTGRWLDEAHPRFAGSNALRHFTAAATGEGIAFYRGPPAYVINKDYIVIERLMLPLASDGTTVDILLGITVLNPRPRPHPELDPGAAAADLASAGA
jgi:hypothetical protein